MTLALLVGVSSNPKPRANLARVRVAAFGLVLGRIAWYNFEKLATAIVKIIYNLRA